MIIKSKNIDEVILSLNFKNTLEKYFSYLIKENRNIIIIYDHSLENQKIYLFLKKKIDAKFFKIKLKGELTTDYVDQLTSKIKNIKHKPEILIGLGGGTVLDCVKAVSVLLTNKNKAASYQGWNLIKNRGLFTIGIPTISGTGAESSKTCVLLNKQKNLKLGFNSNFTCFDKVFLFPEILKSVPKKQLLITASDTYFHSFELLSGKKRIKHADKLAKKSLRLIKEYLSNKDIKNIQNLKKLMLASLYAGEAISFSMVGLVHPFSAAISAIYKTPHCLSNCIVLKGLQDYYPKEYKFLNKCFKIHKITIENRNKMNNKNIQLLYHSTMQHKKPLINHLGIKFDKILTFDEVGSIFKNL